jgi:hypothetical protein
VCSDCFARFTSSALPHVNPPSPSAPPTIAALTRDLQTSLLLLSRQSDLLISLFEQFYSPTQSLLSSLNGVLSQLSAVSSESLSLPIRKALASLVSEMFLLFRSLSPWLVRCVVQLLLFLDFHLSTLNTAEKSRCLLRGQQPARSSPGSECFIHFHLCVAAAASVNRPFLSLSPALLCNCPEISRYFVRSCHPQPSGLSS